jgi:ABC-type Fe3+/spermidine/putrescine transport system ATPase subunit
MSLRMERISFEYPREKRKVLKDFDLEVDEGMIYSLLGSSGSGKTTALNLVAGFLLPEIGRIYIKGKDVTREKVHKRNIGMVFQEYALFPHMTVEANIGFGLKARNLPSRKVKQRISEVMELVNLGGYGKKYPSELSGGERQRVALSRALVYEPDILLLDEPLSALDASLREGLRKELRSILKRAGITAVYVTHDQLEAIAVSDRIGYMRGGKIFEEGFPDSIYWNPVNVATARFMGITNILDVHGHDDGFIKTSLGDLPWKGETPKKIGFRPESLRPSGKGILLKCRIKSFEYRGKEIIADLSCNGNILKGSMDGRQVLKKNEIINMRLDPSELIPFRKSRG